MTLGRAQRGARRPRAGAGEPRRHRLSDGLGCALDRHARHRCEARRLSPPVEAMRLVTGDGSCSTCSPRREPRGVPRGPRRARRARCRVDDHAEVRACVHTCARSNEPMRLDDVLDVLDDHVEGNDHFEFFWVPHTEWAQAKQNNRTAEPAGAARRAKEWCDEMFLENVRAQGRSAASDGASRGDPDVSRQACTMGDHARRVDREVVQGVHHAAARAVLRDGVRRAPRRVRRRAARAALVRRFERPPDPAARSRCASPPPTTSPCRPAAGRDSVLRRRPRLRGSGRTSSTSAASSASWTATADGPTGASSTSRPPRRSRRAIPSGSRFQAVRDQIDPERVFTNAYLDRVLG